MGTVKKHSSIYCPDIRCLDLFIPAGRICQLSNTYNAVQFQVLIIQNLPFSISSADIDEILEAQAESVEQSLSNSSQEVTASVTEETFCGESTPCLKVDVVVSNITIHERIFMIIKDKYVLSITVTARDESKLGDLINYFSE